MCVCVCVCVCVCANGGGVGLSGPRASFLLSSSKLYSVERRTRAGQTVLAELGRVCQCTLSRVEGFLREVGFLCEFDLNSAHLLIV